MTKKFFLPLSAFVLFFANIQAQETSKLDLRTLLRLKKGEIKNEYADILVRGNLTEIKSILQRYEGVYKYSYKNIASVKVPEKYLLAFSREKEIEEITDLNMLGVSLMDTARIRNNVDSAQTGYSSLSHDLKGRGVIVGIIDGGIFWQHSDFKNPNGTTRIRYIWDQRFYGAHKPQPYNYGNEWNWIDINNGNCTHVPPFNPMQDSCDFSHGTCMAGVAAGNGLSFAGDSILNGKYSGIAPEAEIIAVRVSKKDPNFAARIADAVDYIFKKADAMGKPCVINTSIGTYSGPHDGKDLTTQLIETLLDERKGRVLVAAGGNAAQGYQHLSYNISSDTAYTFFKYNNKTGGVFFDWWADSINFRNAQFAIGCNNDTSGEDLGKTSYMNVIADFNPAPNGSVTLTRVLYDNSNTYLMGTVNYKVSLNASRYHVEVAVTVNITPITGKKTLWRLQTRGVGTFDLWSDSTLLGTSDIVTALNGSPIQIQQYQLPDNKKTILGSWQCSDKVITVGNYSNRANYLDIDSNNFNLTENFHPEGNDTVLYEEIIGKRYKTSSIGPTRDNRLKPDIMATGNTTVCTGDSNYIRYLKVNNLNRFTIAYGGKHIRSIGTSVSSAIVAGISALYLEKRPTANYAEIKRMLICTAVQDSFTGATPNYEYGNGKVNAFAALTKSGCIVFGAMDTACINYNALANVDSGSCMAKVYGCIDSTADNYNPLANISNGSCTYTGIKQIFSPDIKVSIVPNPLSSQTTFTIEGITLQNGTIKIINQLGAVADEIVLNNSQNVYTYHNTKLAKGVYYYLLNVNNSNVHAGKLVIE